MPKTGFCGLWFGQISNICAIIKRRALYPTSFTIEARRDFSPPGVSFPLPFCTFLRGIWRKEVSKQQKQTSLRMKQLGGKKEKAQFVTHYSNSHILSWKGLLNENNQEDPTVWYVEEVEMAAISLFCPEKQIPPPSFFPCCCVFRPCLSSFSFSLPLSRLIVTKHARNSARQPSFAFICAKWDENSQLSENERKRKNPPTPPRPNPQKTLIFMLLLLRNPKQLWGHVTKTQEHLSPPAVLLTFVAQKRGEKKKTLFKQWHLTFSAGSSSSKSGFEHVCP